MAASRIEAMMSVLKKLKASTADIEAAAAVSVDGLIMASSLPPGVEKDRIAAMSAAMLSLGDRTAEELGRGELEQVFIKGANGYVILMGTGNGAILTAMARADAKLGLISLDMKRTAVEIGEVI
jgi:predicted regulator of Ras-like GTPase activity (Roadblock/LC7/MglB family)